MFISKRLHAEIVELLTSSHEMRVAALQDQIQDLKKLVFSPTKAHDIPAHQVELDQVLTQNEPKLPTDEEVNTIENELRERSLILSGEYSDFT